jgi:hypothetical protein
MLASVSTIYRLHYGAVSITLWSCIDYIMELYRLHYGAVSITLWSCINYIMELYRLHYGAVSITLWSCIDYIMELYRLHYGAVSIALWSCIDYIMELFWWYFGFSFYYQLDVHSWCPILMSNLTILFLTKSMVIHLLYYGNCRRHWNICITENDVRYEIPSYHEYHRSSS